MKLRDPAAGTILDRVLLPDWGFDPGYWGLAPIIGNVTGEAGSFAKVSSDTVDGQNTA